jgi:uncharacterized surface protein with fasciclin (FAS1) repeats
MTTVTRRRFGAVALAGAVAAMLAACTPSEPQLPTIRGIIDSNASFSTLARALTQAGIQTLDEEGPFTVFAPRNTAFDSLPEGALDALLMPENREELATILRLHVVPGLYTAADLVNRTTTLQTAAGLDIIVDGFNGVNVGGVNVVQPDVMARNGVIHVVDGVLLPPQ